MEQDPGLEEPADAAAAFEALRREVALLKVAVSGLAAERSPAPDYSETLSEIAKGVSVAVGRLGRLLASPAFGANPADMARQIAEAGEEARRQDRAGLQQAQDGFVRAASDLRSWVGVARLADLQNQRLIQAMVGGVLAGSLFGVSLPGVVARAAPDSWVWPEKMAARALGQDFWSAGERLLKAADAQRWQDSQDGAAIVALNRDALANCARASLPEERPQRCVIRLRT